MGGDPISTDLQKMMRSLDYGNSLISNILDARHEKIPRNNQDICPIHLYLIFRNSSWKNQVRRTGYLVYLKLDTCVACKNQL